MITIRIDDVSMNTDLKKLESMFKAIHRADRQARVILAISPLVHNTNDERIFPLILNVQSDWRCFYGVRRCGIPECPMIAFGESVRWASHGLIHVDHRLLDRAAQEMSILVSCSLLGTKIFVPPFNKFNADTEAVCAEHGIELIRWEDGWQHLKFNSFDPSIADGKWYFHTHDFTLEQFEEKLCSTKKP